MMNGDRIRRAMARRWPAINASLIAWIIDAARTAPTERRCHISASRPHFGHRNVEIVDEERPVERERRGGKRWSRCLPPL
jgi:hypothetical protein